MTLTAKYLSSVNIREVESTTQFFSGKRDGTN